jgi:hypothetical protein
VILFFFFADSFLFFLLSAGTMFYPQTDLKSNAFYLKRQSGDWRGHFSFVFFLLLGDFDSSIYCFVPAFSVSPRVSCFYPREFEVYPRVFILYPLSSHFYPRSSQYFKILSIIPCISFRTYKKGQPFFRLSLHLPGNVLLSQGQSPNYHRR